MAGTGEEDVSEPTAAPAAFGEFLAGRVGRDEPPLGAFYDPRGRESMRIPAGDIVVTVRPSVEHGEPACP